MVAIADSPPRPAVARRPWFAVPASPALVTAAAALREAARDASRPLAAQRAAARVAGDAWVESILEGFVLALAAAARGPGAGRRTAATVRDLAERIVGGGARRAGPDRIAAFVAFLDARLGARGGAPTIGFAADAALADALAPVLAAHAAGASPAPPALAAALHATTDAALHHLLDDPVDVLGLGPLARAATRVGRAAIAARVRAEIDRAVTDPVAAGRLAALVAAFVEEPA